MSTGPFVSKVTSKSNTILKEKCEHYVPLHPLTGVKVQLRVVSLQKLLQEQSTKLWKCYVNIDDGGTCLWGETPNQPQKMWDSLWT